MICHFTRPRNRRFDEPAQARRQAESHLLFSPVALGVTGAHVSPVVLRVIGALFRISVCLPIVLGCFCLLVFRVHDNKIDLVGFQETHSKCSGTSRIGKYFRLAPDAKSEAHGDVKLCLHLGQPWCPSDPHSVITEKMSQSQLWPRDSSLQTLPLHGCQQTY